MGLLMLGMFFGLNQTATGILPAFFVSPTRASPGEAYLWAAHAIVATPAALFIGFGVAPFVGMLVRRATVRADNLTAPQRLAVLFALGVLAAVVARSLHVLVLARLPLTDSEVAATFAGRVLARGQAKLPVLLPAESLSLGDTYVRNGALVARAWPLAAIAWAVASRLGLSDAAFAFASLALVLALGITAGRRLGGALGIAAALVALLSPMGVWLSATTDPHVASRAAVSVALGCVLVARDRGSAKAWAASGLALGLAFLGSPLATLTLLAPLVGDGLRAPVGELGVRARSVRIAALGLGLAGPLAVFAAYDLATTGAMFTPAAAPSFPAWHALSDVWARFGANTVYEGMTLAVWFLGPAGVVLVVLGARVDRVTKLVAVGLAAHLLSGVFIGTRGPHPVGPLGSEDTLASLTFLAVHGIARLRALAVRFDVDRVQTFAMLLAALAIPQLAFDVTEARALASSASLRKELLSLVVSEDTKRAVVIAPPYERAWSSFHDGSERGTQVLAWPLVPPGDDDAPVFLIDGARALELARALYPGRPVFRLSIEGDGLRLGRVEPGETSP